jgi:heme/copper-type cytochrome/quinol oxidase subunit 3
MDFNNTVADRGPENRVILMNEPERKRIIFTLFKGAALFFFGLCLLSLFLYAAGTRQGFTDAAQLLLLRLSRLLGLALSVCSAWGMICCVFPKFRDSRFRWILWAGACLLLCAFGAAVNLLTSFIIAASEGNI